MNFLNLAVCFLSAVWVQRFTFQTWPFSISLNTFLAHPCHTFLRFWLIRVPLLYFWGILQDVHALSAGFCSLSEQNPSCFGGASLCLSSCMGWAFLLKPCLCLVLTFILYCPQGLYSAQYPSKTSAPVALCLALTWGKFSLLFASVSSSCFLNLTSVCCPHYTSLYLLWCPAVLGCSNLGTDNHSFLLAFFLKVSKAVVKFRGFIPPSVCHIQNPHKSITLSIALQDFQL